MAVPLTGKIIGFATQGAGGDDEARLRALLSKLPAQIYPFDKKKKWRNIGGLLKMISKEKPDLLIMEGTGLFGGIAVLLAKLFKKIPYVVSSGDSIAPFIQKKRPLLAPLFSLYEKRLYKRSIGFIGWTPYLVGRALSYGTTFGVTAAGWAPFELAEDEAQTARSRVRETFGIPEDAIVIGIVGSLSWNKRIGYCYGYELIRSIQKMVRDDLYVMIVGDGTGKAKLQELARGQKNIIFTGRVSREEVPAYLAAFDLASLPQSVDQVGSFRYTTKVSEYLAAGLPIVTGTIPMAYDLTEVGFYKMIGGTPWSDTYCNRLSVFLQTIDRAAIADKSSRIPRTLPLFNKETQVERITSFVQDILQSLADGNWRSEPQEAKVEDYGYRGVSANEYKEA
ncbi:glycosyltransferase [Gorillibacterium massiliense]|uniref:glycosyltransferase n=1 Tax=Gorillibacterium massiliense TaxID=1280390 RepID=UPI0004B92EC6|nr:glycosyltransferase [Gorillibacterium massiliense]